MPMIALSPVGLSWQKTTCSWSASPAGPLSLWDVANTLVTVATLLISSRVLVEPGSETSVCPRGQGAGKVPGRGPEAPARAAWRSGAGGPGAPEQETDAFRTG